MSGKVFVKFILLSLSLSFISSCMFGNGATYQPPPPKPTEEQLAVEKEMVPDKLVGYGCGHKYKFVVDLTGAQIPNHDSIFLTGTISIFEKSKQLLQLPINVNGMDLKIVIGAIDITASDMNHGSRRQIQLALFRDADGQGWEGTAEGALLSPYRGSFKGNFISPCTDVKLFSQNGHKTNIFDPPDKAYYKNYYVREADRSMNVVLKAHWLEKVSKRNDEYIYSQGRSYELLGASQPEYYPRALQTYLDAANRLHDVRAYARLSYMYAHGLGTKADPKQAAKWNNLFQAAYHKANQVCIAPDSQKLFRWEWQQIERLNNNGIALENVLLGADSEDVHFAIGKIWAGKLITMKKPFKCYASILRTGGKVDLAGSEYIVERDKYGNEYYYNSSLIPGAGTLSALINMIHMSPYTDDIDVYPEPDGSFAMGQTSGDQRKTVRFKVHFK